MTPYEAAALAAIRQHYAVSVTYTGAGLAGDTITAIPIDAGAPVFQGPGDTLQSLTFEIDKSLLPGTPRKGDIIGGFRGRDWSVIERTERDDVEAWLVTVEQ